MAIFQHRRVLSLLLVVALLIGMVPLGMIGASAAEADVAETGDEDVYTDVTISDAFDFGSVNYYASSDPSSVYSVTAGGTSVDTFLFNDETLTLTAVFEDSDSFIFDHYVITVEGETPYNVSPATPHAAYTFTPDGSGKNVTITPVFVAAGDPNFKVGDTCYTDLQTALNAAAASETDKVVSVNNDCIVPTGTYTVPVGVTLLVPEDEACTLNTSTSTRCTDTDSPNPSLFRKLTLASGAVLNVNGSLNIGGLLFSYSNYAQRLVGGYGQLELNEGAQVNLNSGSSLYAWGYVTGKGSVTAHYGSFVTEYLQIGEWRGGTASKSANSKGLFPFDQYYVQNIEAKITFEYGSKETVCGAFYASGTRRFALPFISNESNYLFRIKEGGSITKFFGTDDTLGDDNADYKIHLEIGGAVCVEPISFTFYFSILSQTINTSNKQLPLANYYIRVKNGGVLTASQHLQLLPDTEIVIDNGGTVIASSTILATDMQAWKKDWNGKTHVGSYSYTPSSKQQEKPYVYLFNKLRYSATVPDVKTKRCDVATAGSTAKPLESARIDINGTLIITETGFLGTTDTAAAIAAGTDTEFSNIVSSQKTGVFQNGSTKESEEIHFYTQSDSTITTAYATCETAMLKNGNDTYYTPTKQTLIPYDAEHDAWYYENPETGETNVKPLRKVVFKDFNGEVIETNSFAIGSAPICSIASPVTPNTDQYTYGEFLGWSNAAESQTPDYPVGTALPPMGEDDVTYYYASHIQTENSYKVRWADWDDTELYNLGNTLYTYTEIHELAYPGETPVRETERKNNFNYSYVSFAKDIAEIQNAAEEYSYTFSNTWTPTYDGDDVCTLTAEYTETVKHAVVFLREDKSYINHVYIGVDDEGKSPMLFETPPEKAADAQYTYTASWKNYYSTSADDALFNINNRSISYWPEYHFYLPKYTPVLRSYNVTWMNGEEEIASDTIDYGTIASFNGTAPTKEGYIFVGWDYSYTPFGETEAVTGTLKTDKNGVLLEGQTYPLIVADTTFTAVFKQKKTEAAEVFDGHSLSANGTIGVNFYLDIDAYVADGMDYHDMYATFSWGDDPDKKTRSGEHPFTATGEVEFINGRFRTSVPVAAKEMNDVITVTVFDESGDPISTTTYRASDYAYSIINDGEKALEAAGTAEKAAKLQTLCKSMLLYGKKAQLQFNYHPDGYCVTDELEAEWITADSDLYPEYTTTYDELGKYSFDQAYLSEIKSIPTFYGMSLTLKSDTEVNIVFRNDGTMPMTATAHVKGNTEKTYTVTRTVLDARQTPASDGNGDFVSYNITDIPIAELSNDISITFGDSNVEYDVNGCAYIYQVALLKEYYYDAYEAVGQGAVLDRLYDVVNALYNYNRKAIDYFG